MAKHARQQRSVSSIPEGACQPWLAFASGEAKRLLPSKGVGTEVPMAIVEVFGAPLEDVAWWHVE
eukprot:12639979-Alexandrium_andersonii.AAC.1